MSRWSPSRCALFSWDHAQLEQAVASAPVGAAGLSLLPYLDGERTPNLPKATGVLSGLTRQTLTAPMIARAAMEGVTMNMNYGLRRLAALGVKAKEIRVTGGGAKSAGWRQLMADVFGVPVVAMVEDEGAALGGALASRLVRGPARWPQDQARRPHQRHRRRQRIHALHSRQATQGPVPRAAGQARRLQPADAAALRLKPTERSARDVAVDRRLELPGHQIQTAASCDESIHLALRRRHTGRLRRGGRRLDSLTAVIVAASVEAGHGRSKADDFYAPPQRRIQDIADRRRDRAGVVQMQRTTRTPRFSMSTTTACTITARPGPRAAPF